MQNTRRSIGSSSSKGEIIVEEEGASNDHHVITIESDKELLEAMQASVNNHRKIIGNKLRSSGIIGLRPVCREGSARLPTEGAPFCRIPPNLEGIDFRARLPEIVSIGPNHHGEDKFMEFQAHKWQTLASVLSQTEKHGVYLSDFLNAVGNKERKARNCYLDSSSESANDVYTNRFEFIQMLVLDGCFIIETFRCFCQGNDDVWNSNNEILKTPWVIPVLARDFLKLENQIPFFVLQRLFELCSPALNSENDDPLPLLALKFFNLFLPRPLNLLKNDIGLQPDHLLHLLYLSLRPVVEINYNPNYCPSSSSTQSMQSATQLKLSGMKFRPNKTGHLLEVDFKRIRGVLEIPQITINDFTGTVLINCVALEQCLSDHSWTYPFVFFIPYVAFMSCLINSTKDVASLCADGIIANFSEGDQYVTRLFNELGKSVKFNVGTCYLSRQFAQVEAYYNGFWATMIRTYFSTPWAFISVCSAFLLLALTFFQTLIAFITYKKQF